MNINNNITIYLFIVINLIIFILGYIVGYIQIKNTGVSIEYADKLTNKLDKTKKTISKNKNMSIDIDNTTLVVKSDTSDIEKKYNSLGETKISSEDISSSINKLKNLKQ